MHAKSIAFEYSGETINLELGSSIKKEDLYGKKTATVEKDGKVLDKVLVTAEGSVIPTRATAIVKFDDEGSPLDEVQPCLNSNGEPVFYTSSFKESRPLVTAQPREVVEMCTEAVYPVHQSQLEEGFYRTKFTYRDGPKLQDGILIVKNDEPSYLLVGEIRPTQLIGKTELYAFFDEDDVSSAESEEDVSFAMF